MFLGSGGGGGLCESGHDFLFFSTTFCRCRYVDADVVRVTIGPHLYFVFLRGAPFEEILGQVCEAAVRHGVRR